MYWIVDVKPNEEPIALQIWINKKWKSCIGDKDLYYTFVDTDRHVNLPLHVYTYTYLTYIYQLYYESIIGKRH